MKVAMENVTMEAKYKFIDDNTFEIEISFAGKTETEKVKIESITKEKMVTTSSKGEKKELTRAK